MSDLSEKTLESMNQATWYNQWVKNKFSGNLKGQILEIGCGIGNFSEILANYGSLTAIDINEGYVRSAKQRLGNKAAIGIGDIEKGEYFFGKKTFNSIVCINVLEHIENDRKSLVNIYKLLAPDGLLTLLVPSHNFLYNSIDKSIGHFRRYEKSELSEMMSESGFEVKKIRRLNLLGSIGWFIAGKVLGEKHVSEAKIKIFNLISPIFLFLENLIETPIGTSLLLIASKKGDK